MGLTNWLLKNGIGSPGRTANAFIKAYNNISSGNNVDDCENWESIFYALFMQRYLAAQKMGFWGGSLLGQVNPNEIVRFSNGDMALFIFHMMLLETAQFRNNINNQSFNEVTAVIHEIVESKLPLTSRNNLQTFRYKASQL